MTVETTATAVTELAVDLKTVQPLAAEEVHENHAADKEKDQDQETEVAVADKCSSFKEESSLPRDLKSSERKALAELRALLEDAIFSNTLLQDTTPPEGKDADVDAGSDVSGVSLWGVPLQPSKGAEGTDVVLLKFLRARDFRAGDALAMLRRTLQWRRDWGIEAVSDSADGDDRDSYAGACFVDGADREGHPVCYNLPGLLAGREAYQAAFGSSDARKRFLKWRVNVMEAGVRKLEFKPGGAVSILQVTDLKDAPAPLGKKEHRAAMREALELMQDNYPELVAKNIVVNVPFWYYAFSAIFNRFLTSRTKSKFVVVRPSKSTETLLKYIPAEALPVKYGGLKRDGDTVFSGEDGKAIEIVLKPHSSHVVEIPTMGGCTIIWDICVPGWDVNYKEEFVPDDEGSYAVIVNKGRRISGAQEEAARNSFKADGPGKLLLAVENVTSKKKVILYRSKEEN